MLIQKAGDIIPEVVKSLTEKRTGEETDFDMPKNCPVCGAPVHREDGEAAYRCTNFACSAQAVRNIIHFVSRNAMDIEGMGPSVVQKLIDEHLIENSADIYSIKKDDLVNIDKLGEKSAQNLINAIEKFKREKLPFAPVVRAWHTSYRAECGARNCKAFQKYRRDYFRVSRGNCRD
ncbi:MAG: helix-hairpin-helix domain-containing protein [Clostridiales bacterium]|nr:MAG: helix-hairpin-helix domain-containing protein [Clostridiales bacterium]